MIRRAAFWMLSALAGCAAQELRFREYGPADGLPAGHIFTVLQDQAGYIWLAGGRGVFQFDGHTFRPWTQGVPAGRAHALHETPDGRIWVVTAEGVAYRNPGDAAFRRVDIPVAHNAKLTQAVAASADGRLLLADGHTLWSLGWKKEQLDIQSYAAPANAPLRALAVDSAGRTWLVCGPRLCRFDGRAVRVEPAGLPEENWAALAAGPASQLAVRSETALWERSSPGGDFRPVDEGLGAVAAFYADLTYSAEGDLLVNTTRGLAVRSGGRWSTVGLQNGLPTRTLTALRIDREGTAWLGTASEPGLIRWDRRAPWSTWTRHQGLEEETVWGIARDAGGAMWAAGSSGVFRLEADRRFHTVSSPEKEYARQLVATRDGSVWALINRTKVRRFTGGAAQDFALPARALNYLLVDRQNRLWAIGDHVFRTTSDVSGGAVRFDRLEPLATDQSEDFQQASVDPAGRIFLAGTNGLAIYDPARNEWRRLGTKDGLQSLRLLSVLADSAGGLWVSYRQGLPPTHLIRVGDRWETDRASQPPELGRTLVVSFAEDREKRIWAATEAGVFVWNKSQWRQYRRDDGLGSEDSVAGAILTTDDGAVWVGTTRGLACFNSQPRSAPPVAPAATVADLRVDERTLSFGLRSLSYGREAEQLFLYRLQGWRFFGGVFDSGWQETRETSARHANLPGGRYRLEVKARNAEHVWSARSHQQEFDVPVAWYASVWFGAGFLGGAPALGYLAWRIRRAQRTHAERQARRQFERELSQRTRELEEAKQRADSANQLKTELLAAMGEQVRAPMHAFMGLTQLALTAPDEPKRNEYLRTAHAAAESLLGSWSDLLDYAESESGRLALQLTACDLRDCVRGVAQGTRRIPWSVQEAVPALVRTDRRRLRKVLTALAEGAHALSVEAGASTPLQASMTFRFDGGTMPAAMPFARGSVTAGRASLRAALTLRLVELLGGRLTPLTDGPGVALTVTFPLANSEAESAQRVLLIEDDATSRRAWAAMLEEAGWAVTAAPVREAGSAGGFPVVVLSDATALRSLRSAGRVVFIAKGAAAPREANAVVESPVSAERLVAAMAPQPAGRRR